MCIVVFKLGARCSCVFILAYPVCEPQLEGKRLYVCLTKEPKTNEAFTGIRTFHKDVELFGQLLALSTVLLGFARDARHEVVRHSCDSYRREDLAKRGDELGLDGLDSDVVDETFQGNL